MNKTYQSTLHEGRRAFFSLIGGLGMLMYLVTMLIYLVNQKLEAPLDWVRAAAVFLPAMIMLMALAELMIERAGKLTRITGIQRRRGVGRQAWSGMLAAAVACVLMFVRPDTGKAALAFMIVGGLLCGIGGTVLNNGMKETA